MAIFGSFLSSCCCLSTLWHHPGMGRNGGGNGQLENPPARASQTSSMNQRRWVLLLSSWKTRAQPLLRHSLPLLHPGITGGACCPSPEPGELKPNPERFILLFPAKEQGQKLTLSAFALNKSEPLEVVRTHKSKPVKVKRRKIQGMTPN